VLLTNSTANTLKINDEEFRLALLTRIMLISVMLTTLFATLHFSGINNIGIIQAYTNALFSVTTLTLIMVLNKKNSAFTFVLFLFLAICFLASLSALLTVTNDSFRVIWFYTTVLVAFMFGGSKVGYAMMILSLVAIITTQLFATIKYDELGFLTSISGMIIMSLILSAFARQMTKYRDQLIKQSEELNYLANKDPLTDTLNSKIHYQLGKRLLYEAKSNEEHLSMLCIDIDNFRQVNRKFNKQIGDSVIQHVIKLIEKEICDGGVLAQVSGQEFCVLLPQRDMLSAKEFALRVTSAVEDNLFTINEEKIPLTLSIGIASFIDSDEEIRSLQIRADKALSKAKLQDGNSTSTFNTQFF